MGRVTSDVIRGMSVTHFIGVGHISTVMGIGRRSMWPLFGVIGNFRYHGFHHPRTEISLW